MKKGAIVADRSAHGRSSRFVVREAAGSLETIDQKNGKEERFWVPTVFTPPRHGGIRHRVLRGSAERTTARV
tara:strand:- start:13241 stop:13456 length:216 start_codon:yes stop_codon:yes gene_type:complete